MTMVRRPVHVMITAVGGRAARGGRRRLRRTDGLLRQGRRVDARKVEEQGMAGTTLPVPPHVIDLEGATVLADDGTAVGRVRDIYLQDASGLLSAITVVHGRLRGREILVPAAAIDADSLASATEDESGEDRTGEVRLRIGAAALRAGTVPPDTRNASPEVLEAAARALGLDSAGGESRSESSGAADGEERSDGSGAAGGGGAAG